MGGIGSQELLIIILIGLIFFGAKRLPEIARGLGKGMSEFRKAARDIQNEINREVNIDRNLLSLSDPPPPPSTTGTETTDPAWKSPYPDEGNQTVSEPPAAPAPGSETIQVDAFAPAEGPAGTPAVSPSPESDSSPASTPAPEADVTPADTSGQEQDSDRA